MAHHKVVEEEPLDAIPGVRRMGRRHQRHGSTSSLWDFGVPGQKETPEQRKFRNALFEGYIRDQALHLFRDLPTARVGAALKISEQHARRLHKQGGTPLGRLAYSYFAGVAKGKAAPLHALPRDAESLKFVEAITNVSTFEELFGDCFGVPQNDLLVVDNVFMKFRDQCWAWLDRCRLDAKKLSSNRGRRVDRTSGRRRA